MMRKMQMAFFLLAVTVILAGLTGCPANKAKSTGEGTIPAGKSVALRIKGSDTMVLLVSQWAEQYMSENKNADISVSGGGTGPGIVALVEGSTDVSPASREMKPEEKAAAKEKGEIISENIVARDGIAIVVNPKNPLKEITLAQLAKVFTGEYTNWKQLGGPDEKIVVLTRESSSGTYQFFQEHVLNKADYTTASLQMSSTAGIIKSVKQDRWDIGYVGLGYAIEAKEQVKILPVKATDDAPAIVPSEETVTSGEYSIARPLYLLTTQNAPASAKAFIDFCLSPKGQEIAKSEGFVTVK